MLASSLLELVHKVTRDETHMYEFRFAFTKTLTAFTKSVSWSKRPKAFALMNLDS